MSIEAGTEARVPADPSIKLSRLFAFFVPLGFSASLVTISHVIINSTLAQSANPEIVISSYAIAMSLIGITERPAILLRQTCSALVRDRISFRALSALTWVIFLWVAIFGTMIAFTPLGTWIFKFLFGVTDNKLAAVIDVYQVLMFVSIFSGIRCLYHGVIIYNKRTAWLTFGMFIRLVAMYALSQYYLRTDSITSGRVGAVIFLVGMIIEALVAFLEGRSLIKHKLPEKLESHPIETKREVFAFYRPLLYSSFIAVIIGPAINAILGKTEKMELAIASFAIAVSLTSLVQSFFSYMHQIVLNFYSQDRRTSVRFLLILGFIPSVLIGLLAYTALGPWFIQHILGVKDPLLAATIPILKVFMLLTFIFPGLDFCNGILMLRGQTHIMVGSQTANVAVTLITLFICILAFPAWNGVIGALAQSLGTTAEMLIVLFVLMRKRALLIKLKNSV